MKGISARGYLALFFSMGLSFLFLVGLLNTLVDPYGNLGLNRVGVFMGAEREYKPVQIQKYPHDAVIVGNSMVGGADPAKIQSSYVFYNASMAGAMAEEMRCFVERYVHDEKLVVLALDFNMFRRDSPVDIDHPLPDSATDKFFKRILSLTTVEYSINALWRSWKGDLPGYYPNGSTCNEINKRVDMNQRMEKMDYGAIPEEAKLHFAKYVYEPRRMEEMHRLKQILEERKIPYLVYINPQHEQISAILKESPAYPLYQQWRREIQEIFPEVMDLSGPEFSNPDYYYKFDPGHTTPDASVQIVEYLLRDSPRTRKEAGKIQP